MRKLFLLCAVVVAIAAAPAAYGTPISPAATTSDLPTLYLATMPGTVNTPMDSITVQDNGLGDQLAADGGVAWIGDLGTWSINVSTGLTTPPLSFATMDLNSINTSGSVATVLEIWWSDPELERPFEVPLNYVMNIGGTLPAGMTLVHKAFWGESGKVFDTANEIGTLSFDAQGGFSGSTSNSFAQIPETYSLTQAIFVTVQTGAPRQISFDAELTPTPEPGMMLLVGFGLVVFGAVARRLRSN